MLSYDQKKVVKAECDCKTTKRRQRKRPFSCRLQGLSFPQVLDLEERYKAIKQTVDGQRQGRYARYAEAHRCLALVAVKARLFTLQRKEKKDSLSVTAWLRERRNEGTHLKNREIRQLAASGFEK